jgi:hypothetical protein
MEIATCKKKKNLKWVWYKEGEKKDGDFRNIKKKTWRDDFNDIKKPTNGYWSWSYICCLKIMSSSL